MYKILDRVDCSADVFMQVIEAPAVAAACRPGQFIIPMIHEEGERIPLTIADFDRDAGTIMVDGTDMCGGCRVSVGGQTKFVCVDGPEFDGHQVDFDLMMSHQQQYVSQEGASLNSYLSHATASDATASDATGSDATACKRVETTHV